MKTITRQDYMNGKATHAEYYSQFVTPEIIEIVRREIGEKKLLASKDVYLNNISLHRWDEIASNFIAPLIREGLKKAGDGYSLAGGVCVAKNAARQIISELKPKAKQ